MLEVGEREAREVVKGLGGELKLRCPYCESDDLRIVSVDLDTQSAQNSMAWAGGIGGLANGHSVGPLPSGQGGASPQASGFLNAVAGVRFPLNQPTRCIIVCFGCNAHFTAEGALAMTTGDAFARLGAPAGVSHAADIV